MSNRPRPHRRWQPAAAALLAALLILASCTKSSGSESADTGPPAGGQLSEAAFVTEFGEVCAAIGEELDAIPDPESYKELATQATGAKEVTAQGVTQLEAITPPDKLADQVDEIVGLLQDYSAGFDDLAKAATNEDDAQLDELVLEISAAQEAIGTKLTAAGGIECGTLTAAAGISDQGN